MLQPFHLSFIVPDADKAKAFYLDILGCDLGRDMGDWFDIIFFGHQITIHQERQVLVSRPIDHFGPILDKAQWECLSQRLANCDVKFTLKPTVKNAGRPDESGKYIVVDPAGNLLEFKYYGMSPTEYHA